MGAHVDVGRPSPSHRLAARRQQSGDQWAASGGNPTGRPRSLQREIARIREAAGHIDDLMGEAGLYLSLADKQDLAGAREAWGTPWRERADVVLAEARRARERSAPTFRR
jgi:hypothetical protein